MDNHQVAEQTKKCSKCGEAILASATKCKHCQSDLRNWFSRHKILTGIGALIVIVIVLANLGSNRKTDSIIMGKDNDKKEDLKTHKMNEDVTLGAFKWKLTSVKDLGQNLPEPQVKVPEGYSRRKVNGRFIQIKGSVEFLGELGGTFLAGKRSPTLVDNKGREFEAIDDTSRFGWYSDVESTNLSQFSKNDPMDFTMNYEVPDDATELKMKVDNSSFSNANIHEDKSTLINLGL